MGPHGAVPSSDAGYRQFFRLITPSVTTWYARHNTRNRLGCRPNGSITRTSCADKFVASGVRDVTIESYAAALRRIDGLEPVSETQAELELVQKALSESQGREATQVMRFTPQHIRRLPELRPLAIQAVAMDPSLKQYLPQHRRNDLEFLTVSGTQ